MAKEVRLPQLGQTMEEGTIVNCLVNVGDEVKKGDVIFEIETDKATLEMESPAEGFVKHILSSVDETIPVGAAMMVLGDKDEDVPQSFVDSLTGGGGAAPAAAAPAGPAAAPVADALVPGASSTATVPNAPAGKVMASPRAKRLAADLGVDLSMVKGTGPAGKISEQDVQAFAEGGDGVAPTVPVVAAGEAKLGSTIKLNRLQKLTAERMLKSKQEIPCFYLTVRADMTDVVALRTKMNEAGGVKVSFNDFIIKAVATGLEKYPMMMGQLAGDSIKLADAIHIGLAISVTDGLVAPLLKDVNKKSVQQIATDGKALIERARADKLDMSDLEGGVITVSNLGGFGIDSFVPIVVPGQCSILGIGRISDTCVPENGNILVRKMMNMTLSVDHKVANGAYAAQFLDFTRKLLEDAAAFE